MKKVLKYLNDELRAISIDYHFQKNKKSKPTYPYFVGDLLPVIPTTEDGMKEYTFLLDGFNRKTTLNNGTLFELLEVAESIENRFPSVEGNTALLNGQAIAVFFCSCQPVESGEDGLQKVTIEMTIKTWKGGN